MKTTITLYVQAIKNSWDDDFKRSIQTFKRQSIQDMTVIDVKQVECEIELDAFNPEDFSEQTIKQLEKLKREIHLEASAKLDF